MGGFIGQNNKAEEITSVYFGDEGKARECTAAYLGVNGKARIVWALEPEMPDLIGYYYQGNIYSVNMRDLTPTLIRQGTRLGTLPEGGWYEKDASDSKKWNFYKADGNRNFSITTPAEATRITVQSKGSGTSDYIISYHYYKLHSSEEYGQYYSVVTDKSGRVATSFYLGDDDQIHWYEDFTSGVTGRYGELVVNADRPSSTQYITNLNLYKTGDTNDLFKNEYYTDGSGNHHKPLFVTSRGLVLYAGSSTYGDPYSFAKFSKALGVPYTVFSLDGERLPSLSDFRTNPYLMCENIKDGSVYVTTQDYKKILKFSPSGEFQYLLDFYEKTGNTVDKIMSLGDTIYVISGATVSKVKDVPKFGHLKLVRTQDFEFAQRLGWLNGNPVNFMPYYQNLLTEE